jgi:hypothetical protein
MRWLSLLPFVAACFPRSPAPTASATLANFTELTIFVNDSSFKVLLGDYFGAEDEWGPCSVVGDDLTADLDGVPIPVVSRGAQIGTTAGDDVDDNVCRLPTLELDMPPPHAVSTLTIADARTTVVCTVPDPSAQAQQAVICSPPLNARVFRSAAAASIHSITIAP